MQYLDRHGGSHWWIVTGEHDIVDLTYRHDEKPDYPYYGRGRPTGFTNCGYIRVPKRAQEIIDRRW